MRNNLKCERSSTGTKLENIALLYIEWDYYHTLKGLYSMVSICLGTPKHRPSKKCSINQHAHRVCYHTIIVIEHTYILLLCPCAEALTSLRYIFLDILCFFFLCIHNICYVGCRLHTFIQSLFKKKKSITREGKMRAKKCRDCWNTLCA